MKAPKWARYMVVGIWSVWGDRLYASTYKTAVAMANFYGGTIEEVL